MQISASLVAANPAIAGLVDQKVIAAQASIVATAIQAVNANAASATSVEVCTISMHNLRHLIILTVEISTQTASFR